MIGAAVLVVAAVLVLIFNSSTPASSGGAASQPAAAEVSFTRLVSGMQSGITTRVNYVITSPEEMNELWGMIAATGTPPAVDFSTHAVLAIFAGDEPSASIKVAKIEDRSDERMVSIMLANPDASCPQKTKKGASPYELVAVPATPLPLAHADILTTASCKN